MKYICVNLSHLRQMLTEKMVALENAENADKALLCELRHYKWLIDAVVDETTVISVDLAHLAGLDPGNYPSVQVID